MTRIAISCQTGPRGCDAAGPTVATPRLRCAAARFLVPLCLISLALAAASAQTASVAQPPGVRGGLPVAEPAETQPAGELAALRAEIRMEKSLYLPGEPVRARFTLLNTGAAPVELATVDRGEPPDLIGLPPDLIFGTRSQPALFLQYEGQLAAPVASDQPPPSDGAGVRSLRLAPGSSLGALVPLSSIRSSFQYSGEFTLDWKPFGGRVVTASARFRVEPHQNAVLVTDYGKITFALAYDKAPTNIENFLSLVRDRFYDGTVFHRLIPGYIIQGGSPDGRGNGIRPDGKLIPAEFSDEKFELGTLAMARRPSDPDSASCQFFISLGRNAELDGQYTVIGRASDPTSYETLRLLSERPTDSSNRPLHTIVVRSITLVNASSERARTIGSP